MELLENALGTALSVMQSGALDCGCGCGCGCVGRSNFENFCIVVTIILLLT